MNKTTLMTLPKWFWRCYELNEKQYALSINGWFDGKNYTATWEKVNKNDLPNNLITQNDLDFALTNNT